MHIHVSVPCYIWWVVGGVLYIRWRCQSTAQWAPIAKHHSLPVQVFEAFGILAFR